MVPRSLHTWYQRKSHFRRGAFVRKIGGSNKRCSDTYGAQVSADELVMSVQNHKSLREDNTSMLLFGNGDGGGGPLPAMVRR